MKDFIRVAKAVSDPSRVKIIELQGAMVGAKDLSITFLSGT
ncbi:MAG: hypothetical protein ACOWYE_09020 [Desulfatiglandales bacterium]